MPHVAIFCHFFKMPFLTFTVSKSVSHYERTLNTNFDAFIHYGERSVSGLESAVLPLYTAQRGFIKFLHQTSLLSSEDIVKVVFDLG